MTSSIDRPFLRRLLFPATSFLRGAFSSALPYELGGRQQRVVLLLVPKPPDSGGSPETVGRRHGSALAELDAATAAGLQFQLRTAGSFGPSQPLATLTIESPLTAEQTEQLRFNPWTTGPGSDRPAGSTCSATPPTGQASAPGHTPVAPHPPVDVLQAGAGSGAGSLAVSRRLRVGGQQAHAPWLAQRFLLLASAGPVRPPPCLPIPVVGCPVCGSGPT